MAGIVYIWNGVAMLALDADSGAVLRAGPDPQGDTGLNFTGKMALGPNRRIYAFTDVGPSATRPLWASIGTDLAGPWIAGPVVDTSALVGGYPAAGTFVHGQMVIASLSPYLWSDAALYRFADLSSGAYELVTTWDRTGEDYESIWTEGPFAVGDDFYFAAEGEFVAKIDTATGAYSYVLNLNDAGTYDYDLSAPARDPATGRIYAFGYNGGGLPGQPDVQCALFSGPPGAIGPYPDGGITVEGTWVPFDGPYGYSGSAAIVGRHLFFSGGNTVPLARFNLDTHEFDLQWYYPTDHGGYYSYVVTGTELARRQPPLRQRQRDDLRARQTNSRQRTVRQRTYR